MNEHLPPIDPNIRAQLARRSAGRLPDELLAEVSMALDDGQDIRPKARWRPRWTLPRFAGVGIALALVAILAVAIAVPALHTGPAASPAGYPSGRALTAIELAVLMAGPALPTNTTIVASVTIDARNDVCPMNRYPTVGVIEAMPSQVCVMGAKLSAQLPEPATTGTFAFRYLAPGYLGLLGQITPAPTRLAFRVADEWPVSGKTFLVEGWLYQIDGRRGYGNVPGAASVGCPASTPRPAGDPLDPLGSDWCIYSWLSDDSIAVPPGFAAGQPMTSKQAPLVEAAGVAQVDAIPSGTSIHGVYVVRSVTEQCPNASPQDNRGCAAWRVLAKVADVSLQRPLATEASPASSPTRTVAPPATPAVEPTQARPIAPTGLIGPGNRALTTDELSALIAADPSHLAGRYTVDSRVVCDGIDCSGFPPKPVADQIQPGGIIGLQGALETRPDGGLVWTAADAAIAAVASGGPNLYVVDAWIAGAGEDACDVVGQACYEVSWLGSEPGSQEMAAQQGAYHEFGGGPIGGGRPIHGLFLLQWQPGGKCQGGKDIGADTCTPHAEILARLEPAVLP